MPHSFDRIPSDETLPDKADVVVVGAGIIGVTAALELARAGLSVALVEKGFVAAEQSSRNWGWVRQQGRDRREIKLIVESLRLWEQWQAESPVDLGFRRTGLVSLTRTQAELDRWRRWAERGRAGGVVVEELTAKEAEAALPSRGAPWIGGVRTPTDGRAEPSAAAPALALLARAAGVTIHQETAVRGLDISAGRVQGVVTERSRIAAQRVLVAGGAWSSQLLRRHGVRLPQLNLRSTVARTTAAAVLASGALLTPEFCLRRRLDGGYTLTLRGDESFDLTLDAFRFFPQFLPGFLREHGAIKLRFGSRFAPICGAGARVRSTPSRRSRRSASPIPRPIRASSRRRSPPSSGTARNSPTSKSRKPGPAASTPRPTAFPSSRKSSRSRA